MTHEHDGRDEPLIKGSVIRDSRVWIQKNLGRAALDDALDTLPHDAAHPFRQELILAASWYPVKTWNDILDHVRRRAERERGMSADEFDLRNTAEAGSATLRAVYRFMLGLASPSSVLARVPRLYQNLFRGQARFDATVEPGHAVVGVYDAHPEIVRNCSHHYLTGTRALLDLNGVKDARYEVTRTEVRSNGCFEFRVEHA